MSDPLKEMIEKASAITKAFNASERLRHDYMQRRSFARGMCPRNRDFVEHCKSVDELMPDEKNLSDAEIGLVLLGKARS